MKKKYLGIHGEIRQIALGFAILTVVKIAIFFFSLDVGYGSVYIQDLGYMDFFSDYFTINGIDRGTLIISLSGVDDKKTSITEEDIIMHGFRAEVSTKYTSKDHGEVFCVFELSNLTDIPDCDEKLICIKDRAVFDNNGEMILASLHVISSKFVSLRQYIVCCILFLLLYNIIFLFNANVLNGGSIMSGVFLWIEALVYEGPMISWLDKIVKLNIEHKYMLFTLLVLAAELTFLIYVSRKLLVPKGHYIFTILLSTLALAQFSQIFSVYYMHIMDIYELPPIGISTVADEIYEISGYSFYSLFRRRLISQLDYIKFSFRYFFSFPPGSTGAFILAHVYCKENQQEKPDCDGEISKNIVL